ncbi:CHASE2 domain-containing protein [Opitutus terrae]|uniref:Adenylate/guanylate cyclase with Chase sensor n=1 Tax=Opitutus terrae (strain DSM 11246 / JCM 15787 / PB90-1) TaxID=452637 RepID=B1ZQT8_OPITP|nr:CHASE2 domain-containing protein [Opitutus terrae]ACB77836.1 adenylate/guanylate cyclase with Chase sensor [Opitutus terrae PB90-1]
MIPRTKITKLAWARWLVLLPIPLVWCAAAHFGTLTFLENKLTDWRFRFRGEIDAPVKLLYVDIDSQSVAEIGGMPWSRMYFARVAAALIERAQVKAIGIDVVFSENGVAESVDWKKRVQGNVEFARYLSKTPSVVLAASYAAAVDRDISGQLVYRELPLLTIARGKAQPSLPELPSFRISEKDPRRQWSPALIGLIDTLDGDTRTVPLFAPSEVRTYHHLALELVRLHDGVELDGMKIERDHIDLVKPDGSLARRIPLRDRQLLEVNWFSAWQSARNPRIGFSTVYSYAEMLASEKPEEKAAAEQFFAQPEFKDAMVLIGPVDPLLQDLATTPFDEVPAPKVGVHGNVVKTILSGHYLQSLPRWSGVAWLDFAVVVLLTISVTGLATKSGTRSVWTKAAALLLLAAYVGAALLLFKTQHLLLPMTAPLGAAFTTSFVGVIWQLVDEQKQRGRIKGMFGTYVSPQLVDRMIESGESPQLGGHDAEITAYFSDIQSFSTFSEKLGSGPLVELMNEYLTACTDIVQEEGGTLDKYIGDAVVAMFGAPIALTDHAYRACVASQRVQRKLGELRLKWQAEGAKWPEIVGRMQSRIGLNTGVCMIGNMGSRTRFNYTMMGDNVNLAARMESGAKSWGVFSMCTDATKVACEQHGADRVVFRPLGRIVVKGRTQAVPIHEIVGLKEHVTAQTHECIARFAAGLECYSRRDWVGALALFARSAELEPNIPGPASGISSNPSLVYQKITAHYRAEPPPPDWDGVQVMQEK